MGGIQGKGAGFYQKQVQDDHGGKVEYFIKTLIKGINAGMMIYMLYILNSELIKKLLVGLIVMMLFLLILVITA